MQKKSLVKKIGQGLGVLALSTFVGFGIGYAKEINPEGWATPDETRYQKVDEDFYELQGKGYEYEGKKVKGEVKLESYVNLQEQKFYEKWSLENKTFAYVITESKEEDLYNVYALVDKDGDKVFESKYDFPEDEKELEKEIIPVWVLKKLSK